MEQSWNGGDVALYDLPRRLDDDVVRTILSLSDLQTVVAFSQVSKHSHDLVFSSKDIWLPISRQLQARGYIDLTPDQRIEQFSVDQLVSLIKRIAVASTSDIERILPIQTLSFTIRDTDTELSCHTLAYLTPGGEYLLLCNPYTPGENIVCWSIKTRSVVWDSRNVPQELTGDDIRIVKFTAQVVKPDRLEILVCLRESFVQDQFCITYVVQLWYVDVEKESAKMVQLLSCDPEPRTVYYLNDVTCEYDCTLQINGDHLVARCLTQFVVHNKISGNSMRFDVRGDEQEEYHEEDEEGAVEAAIISLDIFKGTLVVGRPRSTEEQCEILIWDLAALEAQHCYQATRKCFKIDEVKPLQKFKISVGPGYTRSQCYLSPFNHKRCIFQTIVYEPTRSIFRKYLVSCPAANNTVSIKFLGEHEYSWDGRPTPLLNPEDRSFRCVREGTFIDDYPITKGTYIRHEGIAYRNLYSRTIVYVKDRKVDVLYQG